MAKEARDGGVGRLCNHAVQAAVAPRPRVAPPDRLSEADYGLLVALSEAPGQRLRLGELGQRLDWEKSRVSKQISRMSTRGLVAREDSVTDSRGAFAVLTKAGRSAIEAAGPIHVEQVRKWFIDALTPDELEAMTTISAAVVDRLTRHQTDKA
jgi:DNA-binding MarR family transcriptional regulator